MFVSLKLTGGRSTVSDWLVALPPVWVTTIGRRSGEPRRIALYGIPIDDNLALIGSNYGHKKSPAWVHNLEANPDTTVEYRGKSVRVKAREATEDEELQIWITAAQIYVGYAAYRDRARHRRIRVFVLEPLPSKM